jgi:hypothetical protein
VAVQKCVLDAVSRGRDHEGNCNMSGKRAVTSLMYPYASDYMSQCSPFTIDFEVGDPICSISIDSIQSV